MALKEELQAISPEDVEHHARSINRKIASMPDGADVENEGVALFQKYPALARIVTVAIEIFEEEDYYNEDVIKGVGLGAVLAAKTLAQIADIQELPPIE